MKKWIIIILLIALLAVIFIRASHNYQLKKEATSRVVPEKVVPVTTVKPEKDEIVESIVASANIQAKAELALFSKVNGKVAKDLVQLGSTIQPGDVVAIINRDEVGFEYNAYEVKSDVRGVVSRILQNPGAAINPSVPLMHLVDIDTVKAVAAIDELKIRFVSLHQRALVKVQAFPEIDFQARVSAISPICNPATRTIDVEVSIPNGNHRIKPGMFATVQLTESRHQAMLLPISSIVERAGQKYIFIIADGRAQLLAVKTGLVQKDEIEIVSGIKGDEEIIALGANLLESGNKVTVVKNK